MKIRTRLILNYSILTAILLILFSLVVLVFYSKYRQNDFERRLKNRANSSVSMLLNIGKMDKKMLKEIDNSIFTMMSDLKIVILTKKNLLVYSNVDLDSVKSNNVNDYGFLAKTFNIGEKKIEFEINHRGTIYKLYASAVDSQGIVELNNLFRIIIWTLILSILLILGFGIYNAKWSLEPFQHIINEVDHMEPLYLKKRLPDLGTDEVSHLSRSFNTLLDRIEKVIANEKSFIMNASHELRTPVTSIMGQVEVVLNKERPVQEYQTILKSVYDDASHMASLINGFLDIAQADIDFSKLEMREVAIDELLFTITDNLKKRKPNYSTSVEFIKDPESDKQMECKGNEHLLRIMFANIIDNACKFSDNKKAHIKIDFNNQFIIISVIDYGIGIPDKDIDKIFNPLFRGSNVENNPGHGIGMAIVKRIADLHSAKLSIDSTLNMGTAITVYLQRTEISKNGAKV